MSASGRFPAQSAHSAQRPFTRALNRARLFKDRIVGIAMAVGGAGVIIAILLIFVYLVYEVLPLFQPPSLKPIASYAVPGPGRTLHYSLDEQAQIGVRYNDLGEIYFFDTRDGKVIRRDSLEIEQGVRITALGQADPGTGIVALGLSDGRVELFRPRFHVSYPNDQRTITPEVERLFEEYDLRVYEDGSSIHQLAIQSSEGRTTVVAWSKDHPLSVFRLEEKRSFLTDEIRIDRKASRIQPLLEKIDYLLLDKEQRVLYAADLHGVVLRYSLRLDGAMEFDQQKQLVQPGEMLTSLAFLNGDISLLAGASDGEISQWFIVQNELDHRDLVRIRDFHAQQSPISSIVPEYSRKGFLAADDSGRVGLYNATAHRTLLVSPISSNGLVAVSLAPRADAFLAEDRSGLTYFSAIDNEHPEISWSSLWNKVWYENYPRADYVWQSSASNNDFEPKFSLTPLSFGTLKAAFYAMVVATPLAIFGAIYTAYFMAPPLRNAVKPAIEIMEALPTVVLGFLAGLWLAPVLESNLPGILIALFLIPAGLLLFAYHWQFLPAVLRSSVPDGWQPLVLLPLVGILGWLSFALSSPVERWLFHGDMRSWLTYGLGLPFDQRNAIVVGLAMGFAVIPTIFSITEDAVFSVPKHLTEASLALGATPWQTMTRVVLLTASPGIFSALMIGFGRAVGETMIVLMATGNTPVMDFSLFQGMRTLAANIAVEMPESEVGSTHYRVLFLAALVLFIFTFVFNTIAELVRDRLRRRYSAL